MTETEERDLYPPAMAQSDYSLENECLERVTGPPGRPSSRLSQLSVTAASVVQIFLQLCSNTEGCRSL